VDPIAIVAITVVVAGVVVVGAIVVGVVVNLRSFFSSTILDP
jgi:hypothetical protein